MTINELRARKQELLTQKKYEMSLQEQGKGDNFALAMVNEELQDVNAKIRALSGACRVGRHGRITHSVFSSDKQQFVNWTRKDSDQEVDEDRAKMYDALTLEIPHLSDRQKEILLLWGKGLKQSSIAKQLKIDKSTVSRTLKRAKNHMKHLAEINMTVERLRHGNTLDMSDPEVRKFIMSMLTPKQAAYFYLHYYESMTIYEIGELLNLNSSTILKSIQRALSRIRNVLGERVYILENIEALDELVYLTYCNNEKYTEWGCNPRIAHQRRSISVRNPGFEIRVNRKTSCGKTNGRLYQMLVEKHRGTLCCSEIRVGEKYSRFSEKEEIREE